MKKITIKEIKAWINSFPTNDYSKKPTQLEMKRVVYYCNNGTNTELPENISNKNDFKYTKEKALAERYINYIAATSSIKEVFDTINERIVNEKTLIKGS